MKMIERKRVVVVGVRWETGGTNMKRSSSVKPEIQGAFWLKGPPSLLEAAKVGKFECEKSPILALPPHHCVSWLPLYECVLETMGPNPKNPPPFSSS